MQQRDINKIQTLISMQRLSAYLFVLRYLAAVKKFIQEIDSTGRTISYQYDAVGNRISMTTPEGKVITYNYDSGNRLSQIQSDAGQFSFTYDSLGRRTKLNYPNGIATTYSYDDVGRLTNLLTQNSQLQTLNSFTYTHDRVGNRLTNKNQDRTLTYQYDAIYRLTEALSSTPGWSSNTKGKGSGIANATQQQKEYFTYDAVGNRFTADHNRTYTYNVGNQLVTENGITYSYDRSGNLTSKTSSEGTTTFVYDYENRLIKVVRPDGMIIEFKYDPLGRRIEKKVTDTGTVTVKRFFYDNEDILFEYDENGAIVNRYIHGLGIDEPLAVIIGKNIYYYHADGLGSIIALTDSSGKVLQDYQYDSFGNLKDQKNRIKQPYTFTARERDKEIGLYYYRARYYDPEIGRFISEDPIINTPKQRGLRIRACSQDKRNKLLSLFQNNPQRINFYVYVANNTINLVDPFGLIDIPPELYGEIISQILEMVISKTVGGVSGAACASRYCKRKAIPKDWLIDAWAECLSIFEKYGIPTGVPPFTTSEEYVSDCADECMRITYTDKFKEICCVK